MTELQLEKTLDTNSHLKKRKIRKGTVSCWECKRRKIRCNFATPQDTVCDGCKSRDTKCLGQEYYDESTPKKLVKAGDRLNKVEALIEKLIKQRGANFAMQQHKRSLETDQSLKSVSIQSGIVFDYGLDQSSQSKYESIRKSLIAAWPSQEELDSIRSVNFGVYALLHSVLCVPFVKAYGLLLSSRDILSTPSPTAHPIMIARKAMLLCIYLQGIPIEFIGRLPRINTQAIASRLMDTATQLVTNNDQLINSVEGTECTILEACYHNNAGNLRRAWLSNRKAMVLAQMMGLHRDITISGKFLEETTRDRVDTSQMWFRIVAVDRSLSLMLGLPQGTTEDFSITTPIPDGSSELYRLQRMERMGTVAAGLILQRNSTERTNLELTAKIDQIICDAEAYMPPSWWHVQSDLPIASEPTPTTFEATLKTMIQFTHYHYLVQLHLPYLMLASASNTSYDYHRLTAANASRSIVTMFVAFRAQTVSVSYKYCRCIDFITFIACMTLCLAHIEARQRSHANVLDVAQSFRHQRLTDRGLLDRTLDIMMDKASVKDDIISQQIYGTLRALLIIEDESSKGAWYNATNSPEDHDDLDGQNLFDIAQGVEFLRIKVPHIGTIKIEPGEPHTALLTPLHTSAPTNEIDSLNQNYTMPNHPQRFDVEWHSVPSLYNPAGPAQEISQKDIFSLQNSQSLSMDDGTASQYLYVPGMQVGTNDAALQGVDMAFFNGLMQSSTDGSESKEF